MKLPWDGFEVSSLPADDVDLLLFGRSGLAATELAFRLDWLRVFMASNYAGSGRTANLFMHFYMSLCDPFVEFVFSRYLDSVVLPELAGEPNQISAPPVAGGWDHQTGEFELEQRPAEGLG